MRARSPAGWMRGIADKKLMAGAMTVISVIFLLFGLQAVLQGLYIKGLERSMILFAQGIVMLLLAAPFFIKRKPVWTRSLGTAPPLDLPGRSGGG